VFCGIALVFCFQNQKNTMDMKLSARNQLKGKVVKVDEGLITSKVVLDLGCGNIISAIISKDAIADLELKPGMEAFAIIKSTEVIIGTPCDCKKESGNCGCGCH
jgi:molybdopterin-binding protein